MSEMEGDQIQQSRESTNEDLIDERYLFDRSRSNRKSKVKDTIKNSIKLNGLIQGLKWEHVQVVCDLVLKNAPCAVSRCDNEDDLRNTIRYLEQLLEDELYEIMQIQTREVNSSKTIKKRFSIEAKDSQWREDLLLCLAEHRDKVHKYVTEKFNNLKTCRLNNLKPSVVTVREDVGTSKDIATKIAETFITRCIESVKCEVSKRVAIKIQQEIIVFTFECQKSYVLKEIMKDIAKSDFTEGIKYMLDPNKYGRNWLQNFTNKKVFHRRKAGEHFYANAARKEIERVFKEMKESSNDATSKSRTISGWLKHFITNMQNSNSLPFSSNDIVMTSDDKKADFNSFIEIIKSRTVSMAKKCVEFFNSITAETVLWEESPHERIIDFLWGCEACCPFCYEPCLYSDGDHIREGIAHQCIQHRPLGVIGFLESVSNQLIMTTCEELMRTNDARYKFYTDSSFGTPCLTEFKNWKINQMNNMKEPTYWKWYIHRYKNDLQAIYCPSSQANTNSML